MSDTNEPISKRELEVLKLLAEGLTNKEIAAVIERSEQTVKSHLRKIYRKLDVGTRVEAVRKAQAQGLIQLPDLENSNGSETNHNEDDDYPPLGRSDEPLTEDHDKPVRPADEPPAIPTTSTTPIPSPPAVTRVPTWLLILVAFLTFAVVGLLVYTIFFEPSDIAPLEENTEGQEIQIGDTRWFEGEPLLGPRAGSVFVPFGSELFLIGGTDEVGQVTDRVDIFDTRDKLWQTASPKPTAVTDAMVVEIEDLIYVMGGRTADGEPTDIMDIYIPSEDAWGEDGVTLPQPLYGAVAIAAGSQIFLFGGQSTAGPLDTVYQYDVSNQSWQEVATKMPLPTVFAAGGLIEDHFYIVGGHDGTAALDACMRFELDESEWSNCPALSAPRTAAGAVVILDELYVLGGQTSTLYGERYNPENDSWSIINMPMLDDDSGADWSRPSVTYAGGKIFIAGGDAETGPLSQMYVYAPLVYRALLPTALNADGE